MNKDLAKLNKGRAELATITDLPTILEIRNKAKAIAEYAKAKGEGLAVSNTGKQIMLLAEARAGQRIQEMQDSGDLAIRGGDKKSQKSKSHESTLISELGISRDQSSRFQKGAAIIDEDPQWFQRQAEECTEAGRDFTQQSMIREGDRIKNVAIGKRKSQAPRGKYDVIVIDPPWPMKKTEREVRPNQSSEIDYPTMTEDELAQLKIPAADDCHLWLWTTHRFLPMALRLLPCWDFKYVCTFVWHKPGGFQPHGLPQYNCEFALYARRGSPKFAETKAFPVCFQAARGGHSEKPQDFYEMVRRVTGTCRRLDMFNRRKIVGFKSWGNEAK